MDTYILLCAALELKNTEVAKLLLTSSSNDYKNSTFSNSPLHFAILNDDTEIIQIFLNKEANTNAENFNGKTALHDAIERMKTEITDAANRNSQEIMNLLSSRGTTVNNNENDAVTSSHIASDTGKHCPALHLAVDKGNEEISELLLSKGANVNAEGRDDKTALHIATEKGHSKIVELLLKHGADVDSACTSTPRKGYTSLHLAAEKGHKKITKLLLYNGANVDARGNDGATSLHIATEKGYSQIVENLLNAGADVNSAYTTRHGYTPLHLAAKIGDIEITELLLNSGGDVDAKGDSGVTSLHIATERGYSQIVRLLLKHGADINSAFTSTIREGRTSLHLAAVKGDEEITELLLSKGADVNAKGRHDTTALHIATEKGRSQIVQLLLKHGADVNSVYTSAIWEDYTSLHLAVERGDEEITRLLLNGGADVEAKQNSDTTSLHIATERGHLDIVAQLLKHGACVDSVSWSGRTPLYFAVVNKQEEIVKLLLECGADVNAEDRVHESILHCAVVRGSSTIVEHILKHRPDLNNPSNSSVLYAAARRYGAEYKKILKYLFRYGFTVNPKDANKFMLAAVKNGHTELVELLKHSIDVNTFCNAACETDCIPLHLAVKWLDNEMAELLIRYGADVNAPDETGRPAIFYATENADLEMAKVLLTNKANVNDNPELLNDAVREGRRDIVEVLLQNGADVNGTDKYGRMPLHFIILDEARKSFQQRDRKDPDSNAKGEIAKLLLSWGANPNTRVQNSMPMLHAAIEKGYVEVVEALLEYNADVNSTCEGNITPLHLSALIGNDKIVEMLLNKGANIIAEGASAETAFRLALNRGDTKVVELLLTCRGKRDTMISSDLWTFHLPEIIRSPNMVELLLKFGVNFDFADVYGFTALHYAVGEGFVDIVKILLEHGADITVATPDNRTPLGFVMDGIKGSDDADKISNFVSIAEILKRHIIKIKAANLYAENKLVLSISGADEEQSDFLNESDAVIARVYSTKVCKERRLARYEFQDECEKEVARMKREKFVNTNITFYDILKKYENVLAMYAKNESIVEALESGDYKEKFPIYASMINRNFRNGEKRREFLERSKQFFYSFFQNFPELPHICIEKIFSYLNDDDVSLLLNECKIISLR